LTTPHFASTGLPSDFREIVMKEFDAQVALQFSQLATKRKWSISGDISTYKNNIFWQINCRPVKVTLFGEPAQVRSSLSAVCYDLTAADACPRFRKLSMAFK
jgi:hypothetical protein